jgi:hypothetical protein
MIRTRYYRFTLRYISEKYLCQIVDSSRIRKSCTSSLFGLPNVVHALTLAVTTPGFPRSISAPALSALHLTQLRGH